jgi:putative tryptophan/tyrosine transport system substrate-binding protein
MRRREFLTGAAATAVVSLSGPVDAQTVVRSPRSKRIAIFHPTEKSQGLSANDNRAYKAFFDELHRLGYIERKNLIVEWYSALGRSDRYGDLAREIVASRPDLIISVSGAFTRQLKPLTATIPILGASADPVTGELVTNPDKPDQNITGVSVHAGLEVYGKRLQFLGEIVPTLKNVRLLVAPSAMNSSETILSLVREAASRTGISMTAALLDGKIDRRAYERVFDAVEKNQVDGLVVGDAAEHITYRQLIVDLAARHRLPAIYPFREFVEVGGLMAYGVDSTDLMRRLAIETDAVLRGAKPGNIPYFQQSKFELVLNRTAAKALGLEFPASQLSIASEVIN